MVDCLWTVSGAVVGWCGGENSVEIKCHGVVRFKGNLSLNGTAQGASGLFFYRVTNLLGSLRCDYHRTQCLERNVPRKLSVVSLETVSPTA